MNIIDTLFLEILLSPTLESYALNTKHTAKDDVKLTVDLLTNQILRLICIPEMQFNQLAGFLNADFQKLIRCQNKRELR